VREGQVSVDDALTQVARMPYDDLGFARLDTHRGIRKGMPEVVLCQWKTPDQVAEILERLTLHHERVLATRASADTWERVRRALPNAVYHEAARVITVGDAPAPISGQPIVIATGGTSDMPVAEEAAITATWMGCRVERLYDVGVAGLHRTLMHLDLLNSARVVIAVAGMEGALPSVLAGLLPCPIVAVPTTIGYGAHFNGLAPLLTMLNSCATGIAVVNIDNGFGAGVFAAMIARQESRS
jgi:NCAIR mutase (PurE)-related protein